MKMSRRRLAVWALSFAAMIAPIAVRLAVAQTASKTVPTYPDHTKLMVVRDGLGRELPIGAACDWDVRRDHILAQFQRVAGPLPGAERRVALEMQVIAESKEPGCTRKKVTFATEPGDRAIAWLLIPEVRPETAPPGGRGKLLRVLREGRPRRVPLAKPSGEVHERAGA